MVVKRHGIQLILMIFKICKKFVVLQANTQSIGGCIRDACCILFGPFFLFFGLA